MTRSELIKRIALNQPHLTERDVKIAVMMLLEQMAAYLADGGRIEIRGVGSFSLRFRAARIGRNSRTGAPVSLPTRYVPCFKPAKRLLARVNREDGGPP